MDKQQQNKIIEAADLFNKALRKLVVVDGGIHAETIIAAASRMAGTMLFRSFPPQFAQIEPGTPVVSDEADSQGPALMQTMFATLRQLGHTDLDEHGLGGARESTSLARLSLAQTQQTLEPWCRKIMQASGLSFREMAVAAAVTAGLLIHDCASVLPIHSGCSIAVHGMVEALKTAPQALATEG
ncbi:MAG: hypothetical protein H6955_05085 [Chromatiaceae bacterium]|nr:hypothetical protein [Chromatiaceae bacterium]